MFILKFKIDSIFLGVQHEITDTLEFVSIPPPISSIWLQVKEQECVTATGSNLRYKSAHRSRSEDQLWKVNRQILEISSVSQQVDTLFYMIELFILALFCLGVGSLPRCPSVCQEVRKILRDRACGQRAINEFIHNV